MTILPVGRLTSAVCRLIGRHDVIMRTIGEKEVQNLQMEDGWLSSIQRGLYTAAVSDILDELGYRHQTMHQRLRPLLPDIRNCGFAGRARTFLWKEADHADANDPYGLEIEAMDSLRPGDVAVHSTDIHATNAPWGELMSTIAKRNGAVGCVCDSQIRDCVRIIEMNFPVYCSGIRPVDSKGRGRVEGFDVPIPCGGVQVNPGDLIFADFDGIVVIPHVIEQEVIQKALEKAGKENLSRQDLLEGKSLREVYNKYGVL
jgi:4-hydroxy-4-methyl-2-oxoglutarate aldolase